MFILRRPAIFDAERTIESDHVHKYAVTADGQPVSRADVLERWVKDAGFCAFFISLLSDSPFAAYRWETPPMTQATATRNFEFVLVDSPALKGAPDSRPFADRFTEADYNGGIAVFQNIGKDATLIAPSPRGPNVAYTYLAAFIRGAPDSQKRALWRTVGRTAKRMLSEHPLWISTAGGGVAWLHVRLDSRPKYYTYAPYRTAV